MYSGIDKKKLRRKKGKIIEFINNHDYSDYLQDMFIGNILSGTDEITCGLYQLYSKFGVIEKHKNIYLYFLSLMEYYKFLSTNCCEVSAGRYPYLAEIIYPKLRKNKKSLTIYEPDTVVDKIFDVDIKKEFFTKDTDIEDIDTLYGTFTCEATIEMVESTLVKDKNLLISLCDCNLSTEKYPFSFEPYFSRKYNEQLSKYGYVREFPRVCWYESFCDLIKKEYGSRIQVLNWPSIYGIKEPILLSVTQEHKRKCLKM